MVTIAPRTGRNMCDARSAQRPCHPLAPALFILGPGETTLAGRALLAQGQSLILLDMPLSLAQAHVLIGAAHDHAVASGWKIAVAVVDEGGLLIALGRMDGAFPLSAQIAEAKAAGTALWHRDGEKLAASRASHEGFFDAVSRLVRLPLIPGPGSVLIRSGEVVLGAAGASGASGDDDRDCVEAGLRAVFPD
jgi:glc operon protein GlcG